MTEPSDEETQALDEALNILVLISGKLKDGAAHYAYLSVPLSKYELFKQAEAAGNYDAAQYGKILAHGKGKEPPLDVQQRMEEEYSVNHTFEKDVNDMMARLQKKDST